MDFLVSQRRNLTNRIDADARISVGYHLFEFFTDRPIVIYFLTSMPGTPPTPNPKSRKTRLVRRRGRGKDGFDSDDEIVREVGTDSESDDDDHSSVGSATDSDTGPASEEVSSNGPHSRALTPNTTQSSADAKSLTNAATSQSQDGPLFEGGNWSEMVAEEATNGPFDLPVVEFADLSTFDIDHLHRGGAAPSLRTSRSSKRPPVKRAASAPNVDRPVPTQPSPPQTEPEPEDFPTDSQSSPSTSRQPSQRASSRRPGQSARQAYQQRLESDPSFVPRVGDFWGHDDRLLDKNWRSLSGWWRGRWQGRGRGFVGGRGRGVPLIGSDSGHRGSAERDSDPQEAQKPTTEVPRVDQPWTHDGYEEMSKREERKHEAQQQQQQQEARPTRGFSPRGRSAFPFRGRRGMVRGRGFASSPTRPLLVPPVSTPDRTWYAMKPERVWTKQHDSFLYIDSNLKPRPSVGPGYRVKLSSAEAQVVRGPVNALRTSTKETLSTSQAPPSEDGDKAFVVRLPQRSVKEKVEEAVSAPSESLTTVEDPPIDDVFVVRPELAPPRIPIAASFASTPPQEVPPLAEASSQAESSVPPPSTEAVEASSSEQVPGVQSAQSATESSDSATVAHHDAETLAPSTENDTQETSVRRNVPPVPPPLQTVFPLPQPSPPYSSHYGYASPLPPGIAVNQHGMAYDVTTGRPVYLQAPLYTPRPMAHGMMTPPGMTFIPGHMHHHSGSPDFLAPPHTPPLTNFIDPTTGGPLFSFPRQSARVEIRAPLTPDAKVSTKSQRRPSGLRTSAAAYEPSQPISPDNAPPFAASTESYVAQNGELDPRDGVNAGTPGHPVDAAMLGYSAYPHQQPYYYPDQYGYSHYYDVSQVPQYEMYHADPHTSQGVVYY